MMLLSLLLAAQAAAAAPPAAPEPAPAAAVPSPGEIAAAAPAADWVAIAPSDLLVMDLAPDMKGTPRRVVIQLMSPPFSQGWVGNIRRLVAAKWYDGISINRVQDNYVVQWGDADGEDAAKAKKLPEGLAVMREAEYTTNYATNMFAYQWVYGRYPASSESIQIVSQQRLPANFIDPYSEHRSFAFGFPVGYREKQTRIPDERFDPKLNYTRTLLAPDQVWPVHCYGMVGVGRGFSPDTGTGAELYTVIGHAPRHLDRNIALVGRVIAGIEHLSSLPRGTGPLGFYEKAEERVPVRSIRMGSEVASLPTYQYLSTESASFAAYADARANRRDPFFIVPAGGADICNIPVPIRVKP